VSWGTGPRYLFSRNAVKTNTTRQSRGTGVQTLHPIFLLEPSVPFGWSSRRRTGRRRWRRGDDGRGFAVSRKKMAYNGNGSRVPVHADGKIFMTHRR